MVLYIDLDQKSWATRDYTDSTTYDLSGTIYRNAIMTTAETALDTFTGSGTEFRLVDPNTDQIIFSSSVTGDFTLNSDGTFQITFAQVRVPFLSGAVKLLWILEKSGSRITAIGVNGSNMISIHAS